MLTKAPWLWKWDFRVPELGSPQQLGSGSAGLEVGAKQERTLFSSSCGGSPFPPGGVLELHRFLITKGKQARPWCSEQREERNQLPACRCLKHRSGEVLLLFPFPRLQGAQREGTRASEGHRALWVGRDFENHLIPTPCREQGHLPLDH